MAFFVIAEKHKLVNYVLHAKHRDAVKKGEKEKNLMLHFAEDFDQIWDN